MDRLLTRHGVCDCFAMAACMQAALRIAISDTGSPDFQEDSMRPAIALTVSDDCPAQLHMFSQNGPAVWFLGRGLRYSFSDGPIAFQHLPAPLHVHDRAPQDKGPRSGQPVGHVRQRPADRQTSGQPAAPEEVDLGACMSCILQEGDEVSVGPVVIRVSLESSAPTYDAAAAQCRCYLALALLNLPR